MENRVKITPLETARLTCPQCERSKTLQLSEYKLTKRFTRVKYTCNCGETFVTTIESRAGQKKDIRLAGTFTLKGKTGKTLGTGRMVITRMTAEGLTMRLDTETKVPARSFLEVEFVLDDAMQSVVTKKVRAVAKNRHFLTAEFTSTKHLDNLGPYLYFNKLNE
ncbi:MAG: hypothetical protein HUN04_10095 [Desulfobacter sp.]|nr:MAG: hypothetical protein HUN04_10095 [Desulfobacter sp.]